MSVVGQSTRGGCDVSYDTAILNYTVWDVIPLEGEIHSPSRGNLTPPRAINLSVNRLHPEPIRGIISSIRSLPVI